MYNFLNYTLHKKFSHITYKRCTNRASHFVHDITAKEVRIEYAVRFY